MTPSPGPSTAGIPEVQTIRVGVALPHYDSSYPQPPQPGAATVERVVEYAERVEELGLYQGWVSDHFWLDISRYGGPAGRQGTPECWITMSALAARTRRLRIGSLVLALGFRPPTLLAKMTATLDQLAGGRLDLGLGAGWLAEEYLENGYDFPGPGTRLRMLEEQVNVLRTLLGPGVGTFQGRYYTALDAPVRPGPVQQPWPPLWVGGRGDQLLGVVARVADGWNTCWAMTPEAYQQRLGVLAQACRNADRDPAEIRRSLGLNTLVGRDDDDVVRRWRKLQAWAPGGALDKVDLREWASSRLVGTAAEVVAKLRTWQSLGVEQVVATFGHLPFSIFEDEQLDLMAELVVPQL